jgi:hypothetical protein
MTRIISPSAKCKVIALFIAFLFAVVGFSGVTSEFSGVEASAFGPAPSHTNAPGETNCTQCHRSFPVNSGTGSVVISGLPAGYTPGQQVQVSVTTSQSDAIIYGFQLVALDADGRDAGTFTLPGENPQRIQLLTGLVGEIVRTYVEHTIDGVTPTTPGSNSWTFNWTAPANDIGAVTFYAAGNAANSDGNTTGDYIYTTSRVVSSKTPSSADFDGDGKTDIGISRLNGGNTEWWLSKSTDSSVFSTVFGVDTDIPAPADFTGDGKADITVFRPSTGEWYVLRSEDLSFLAFPFGQSGDIPMPADYDGDGRADAAVFRPSTGTWFISQSSGAGTIFAQFGTEGDEPVASDYDGDGKADIGIVRNNGGNKEWWIQRSQAGFISTVFGVPTDKTVPGDYTGDGRSDIAIFRPTDGQWFVLRSEDFTYLAFPWGQAGDVPAPGDYDGDGKWDAAVFRPTQSTWFVNRTGGAGPLIAAFGSPTDRPVAGSFVR